jgi:hypothetical protein
MARAKFERLKPTLILVLWSRRPWKDDINSSDYYDITTV